MKPKSKSEDPDSGTWPTSIQELTESERLVVWTFRRWVSGSEHRALLLREFDRQFRKADAGLALEALDVALMALTRAARRRISHHQPCCPCLCPDEVCFLAIVAAQQNGASGAARAMAQWLIRSGQEAEMIDPLAVFADCLHSSGHHIPYRTQTGARDAWLQQPAVAMRLQ